MSALTAYFLFISSINFTLALVVFLRNRNAVVNRLFSLTVIWAVLWTFSDLLLHQFANSSRALFFAWVTFATAGLIPAHFLLFARAFPAERTMPKDFVSMTFLCIALAFVFVSFSGLMVSDVVVAVDDFRLIYGPLYPAFAVYFVGCFATAFYFLARTYRGSRGISRLRLRYLFLGTFLAVIGGATTNLIIPLAFNTSRFSFLGPAFTVFVFGFVAHAILRHRLMDIRVVITRGASYFISLSGSAALLLAASWATYRLIGEQVSPIGLFWNVIVGISVALAFRPTLSFSRRLLNRYTHRGSFDHTQVLQRITRRLSSSLERTALLENVVDFIREVTHPEFQLIYSLDDSSLKLLLADASDVSQPGPPATIELRPEFQARLARHRILTRDDLASGDEASTSCLSSLYGPDWEVLAALGTERQVAGLLVLGPKRSGDPYFSTDLQLIEAIASQAGILLANASLYEEVKAVKERIEGILRNMESGVVAVNQAREITTINPVAESLLGLTPGHSLGKPLDILPVALAAPLEKALTQSDTYYQADAELTLPSGRHISIVLSTSLFRGTKDETLGAILVFSDHSKIRQLEREKRQLERVAAFQEMAAAIAHEIKNPLVAIKTFAELLPERFRDEEFRENFSRVVVNEISRIDDLIARLRGVVPPPSLDLRPVDLREPIDETLALLRGRIEQMHISVSVEADHPAVVSADRVQLKQLFLNLFINALESMQTGGQLTLRLYRDVTHDGPRLVVKISDTGTGIPDSLIANIFDPFVTTKLHGSGLGLSICRGIAEAHQASLRAENNTSGPGASIFLEFPLDPATTDG